MAEFRREDCKQCGAPVPPRRRSLCDNCAADNIRKHNVRHGAEMLARRRKDRAYREGWNAYQRERDKRQRELDNLQIKTDRRCQVCGGPIPYEKNLAAKYCKKYHRKRDVQK